MTIQTLLSLTAAATAPLNGLAALPAAAPADGSAFSRLLGEAKHKPAEPTQPAEAKLAADGAAATASSEASRADRLQERKTAARTGPRPAPARAPANAPPDDGPAATGEAASARDAATAATASDTATRGADPSAALAPWLLPPSALPAVAPPAADASADAAVHATLAAVAARASPATGSVLRVAAERPAGPATADDPPDGPAKTEAGDAPGAGVPARTEHDAAAALGQGGEQAQAGADSHRDRRDAGPAAAALATTATAVAAASADAGNAPSFQRLLAHAGGDGTALAGAAAASAAAAASPASGANTVAAPVQASIATPATSPEFQQALGVQVSVLAQGGVQQAQLQLNPAEMGPISVSIRMDGDQARVDFGADLARTRDIIEAGWAELAASLHDAGFTLSGGGVSSQHPQGGQADTGGANAGRNGGGKGIVRLDDPPVQRLASLTVRAGGVDVFA